ncbi:MAG: glutathione S-transferase N-terminal domain-containing protein [Actinomycetota bacterium]|nr:glutathione S-transferase N-terminal domain-containing protein [Actinomycetota bacterium]
MARKVKLYMFTGSGPSLTAQLMLEHKGIGYKRVHVLVGPHTFSMLGRRFERMTVPALKIDGRRVQGSREISRELDELVPQPALFPADAQRRRAVIEAERWGEELQDAGRRIFFCAARRDPRAFMTVLAHDNPVMRPAQRVSRRFVTRLATAGCRASDFAGEEDLAGLPARLDQIDAWIEQGLLNAPELNAADFQIAPSIALLLRFDDLVPHIEQRRAAQLARRLLPDNPARIGPVLPSAWLAPLAATANEAARREPTVPDDGLRAISCASGERTRLLHHDASITHRPHHG